MSAKQSDNFTTTNNAGVPPAPSEAHQRSGIVNSKIVVMNGSKILMRYDGRRWWNKVLSK